ncbi:hypothetical protein LCGC14_2320530, partial [marine sediment metagenome]
HRHHSRARRGGGEWGRVVPRGELEGSIRRHFSVVASKNNLQVLTWENLDLNPA